MSTPTKQKAAAFTGLTEPNKIVELLTSQPVPEITPNQLLVRVKSNAINPTDWKHIAIGWGSKGCIPGSDMAGEVVKVGSKVTGFKIGDHVSSFAHGGYSEKPNGGLFQEYVAVDPYLSLKYENGLTEDKSKVEFGPITTFEGAASVTLGLVTVGLSLHNSFKLSFDKTKQEGKKLLIWGGASATGFLAIQIAKKVFGLTVLAVSSSKHHDTLKSVGADFTFDYKDFDVVDQIKKVGGEDLVYAFDTISDAETFNNSYESLSTTRPATLENLLFLTEDLITVAKKSNVTITGSLAYLARGEDQLLGGMVVPSSPEIVSSHLEFWREISKYVNDGSLYHLPLKVLPHGLGSIDEAFALMMSNKVSFEKLIVDANDTDF